MTIDIVAGIIILVFSVVLHEVAHGYAANWLGDPTARLAGRLTLNPIAHIDPMGSVIIPAILVITGSPILFGYAKPVPYNPYNLRGKGGEAIVAGAGAFANFLIAIALGLIIRFFDAPAEFTNILATGVYINIFLGIFNLIPIPPLDGSKVIGALLPHPLSIRFEELRGRIESFGMFFGFFLVLLLFYLFSPVFSALTRFLFRLFTGIGI